MTSYSTVTSHRAMVFDQIRNDAYAAAIRHFVTPDSVVLDLGAGLGILGFIAAACGARKVYMVDPSPVLNITRQIAQFNGLQDGVECFRGRIEEIDLPEKVDLVISVFTGNFLLEEDLLPSLFHARDRYLKPGGVLLPDRAIMRAVPVSAATFHEEQIATWSDPQHGIDFSNARSYAANHLYSVRMKEFEHVYMAEPRDLLTLDFNTAESADCRSNCRFEIVKTGKCHGFLGWFKTRLGAQWLSTSPQGAGLHWSQKFLPLDPPFELKESNDLDFKLFRPQFGDWTWQAGIGPQQQKKSTFLSGKLSLNALKKRADGYRPQLNQLGEAARFILENLDSDKTLGELKKTVVNQHSSERLSPETIENLVQSLVNKYG